MVILDLETVSAVDIKKRGTAAYAADSSTFISVICFKELGKEKTYTLTHPLLGAEPNKNFALSILKKLLHHGTKIIALNAAFERHMLNHKLHDFMKACDSNFKIILGVDLSLIHI